MTSLLAAVAATLLVSPVAGAPASRVCGGGGIPYPQAATAAGAGATWIACRDRAIVVRVRPADGRVTRTIHLRDARPWSLVAAKGFLWVIDRDRPALLKIDPGSGRVRKRIPLADLPDVVWSGAGSIWIGYEHTGAARIDPATGRVRPVAAGDGVSGFATDGSVVWIVSHRDNRLTRVEADGSAHLLAPTLAPADTAAAEHIAYAGDSLWITGRGLDLLRIDPTDGATTATVDIGPAGIDVVESAGRLFVAVYTARGAQRGDPLLGSIAAVDPATGSVTSSVAVRGRFLYAGLVVQGQTVLLADTVDGVLVRVPRTRW